MDLEVLGNKCKYCNENGKYKKRFNTILCDRHYRQLLKYGKVISTRNDPNSYYAVISIDKYDVKIDIEDVNRCKKYKWRNCGDNGYIFTKIDDKKIYLQNYILNTDLTVDHINHDIYDCRKENLRKANKSKNMMNSLLSKRNSSGVKGVSYDKERNKWYASITKDNKTYNLGRYESFHDAVLIRFKKEIELFGEFSIYYNKDNNIYVLDYFYENQYYSIKYNGEAMEVESLGNKDRNGFGSTGTK